MALNRGGGAGEPGGAGGAGHWQPSVHRRNDVTCLAAMEQYKHKVKVISNQYYPISVRALLLGRFLGFALCPSGKSNV
jgi:hypothetical protein